MFFVSFSITKEYETGYSILFIVNSAKNALWTYLLGKLRENTVIYKILNVFPL